MPYIQNASTTEYYNLEGIAYMAPGAIIWVSQALYDNDAAIAAALIAGDIVVATGISAPSPDEIPHQFETEFQMSIRSGATATSLQLQFMESLGGFEDSAGDLYDAGDTFITFRAELVSDGVYLLWEGLQGEDPGDGSIALTLTNNENFQSGQSYPATLGAGGGEYNLTTAAVSDFIVTAEVSGGSGGPIQQFVMVAKSGEDYTSIQDAIDSISDAASDKIYTVLVYAGEYDETITLGDYINIVAVDPKATKILRSVNGTNVHCYLNITIESANSWGLYLENAASNVTVDGDISSSADVGIFIISGTLTVNGDVSSSVDRGISIDASEVLSLTVNGNISSDGFEGVYITSGGETTTVIINGNISSTAHSGFFAGNATSATITIRGNISSSAQVAMFVGIVVSLTVENGVIQCTWNNASGHAVQSTSSNKLYLQNVKIICTHADANSLYASAGPIAVSCYDVYGNRACHSNITNLVANGFKLSDGTNTDVESITSDTAGVAASLNTLTTLITTDGDENLDNVTLADGQVGQVKIFAVVAEGHANDTIKITPANLNGGTQITFSAAPVGEGCTMLFSGAAWNIVANNGGTIS